MKKITFVTVALLAFASSFAGGIGNGSVNLRYDDPIMFTERGIQFFVFSNGEFDFNTEHTAGGGTYYRRGGSTVNVTHGAPNQFLGGGVSIEHDSMGRVRRIGNVFVNYDAASRIKRIGTIYMSYGRLGLTQVGGMKIIYDRRGNIVNTVGNVKSNGFGYATTTGTYYGPAYGSQNSNIYFRGATSTRQ